MRRGRSVGRCGPILTPREVPCHRVIAADRTLGGFAGDRTGDAIARKIALLRSEGVEFDEDGRVSAKSVLTAVP